jgi:hypothetical protein
MACDHVNFTVVGAACTVDVSAMLQVIYASAAIKPFSAAELKDLLAKARKHNSAHGITGLLLYHKGSFIQVLEGPPEEVAALLASIEKDKRHHEIRLLLRDEIEANEFEDWSMGFIDLSQSAKALEGFLNYNTDVPAHLIDKTLAKKALKSFQEGVWRQRVQR